MRGPRPGTDIFDRQLACEEDMEAAIHSIIALAVKAGWTETEACVAITVLADHRMLSSLANRDTAQQVEDQLNHYLKRRPRN
jgi:hypothetical protein